MNSYVTISSADFYRMLREGLANLQKNCAIVNDLNVFPIPDGDTGDNLCMTLEGGLRALEGSDPLPFSIGEAADTLAQGSLLAARGNSGVILSQLLCGIAEGLAGKEEANAKDMASAFQTGVRTAYEAVLTPTEGTILTVSREAADVALAAAEGGCDVAELFLSYQNEIYASLLRTPDLLPILKQADVVDSGGAGLFYIVEGMRRALLGETVTENNIPATGRQKIDEEITTTPETDFPFGYCTETLLQLQTQKCAVEDFSIDAFIQRLSPLGDSIVAFKTDHRVKLHIHTKTPGTVLGICQEYGELLKIKVENMSVQHSESRVEDRFRGSVAPPAKTEKKPYGIVCTACGSGIIETFRQMGADQVVDGGAGHNPSAKDFLDAYRRVAAKTIFVLPNNGNILLAAKQAAGLYPDAEVIVLESKTLGEGYAALSMFDPDCGDTDAIRRQMEEAMGESVTGSVSVAVRDARLGNADIVKGQYLGLCDKELLSISQSPVGAAAGLLAALHAENHEVLLCIYGLDASDEDRIALQEHLKKTYPRTEFYEIEGGQALHRFLFVLE